MDNEFVNPMEFENIDDFIMAIEIKYKAKKRNNYDDESQTCPRYNKTGTAAAMPVFDF